jgi:type V secretory pathway adhesin AidA
MAQQVINIGTAANDGSGDPLRSAFDKANDNFSELYSKSAAGSNLDLGNNDIEATNTNGGINLIPTPGGTGKVVVQDNSVSIAVSKTVTNAVGASGDTMGMVAWDADYIYVCTADYDGSTSVWKRSAIATW